MTSHGFRHACEAAHAEFALNVWSSRVSKLNHMKKMLRTTFAAALALPVFLSAPVWAQDEPKKAEEPEANDDRGGKPGLCPWLPTYSQLRGYLTAIDGVSLPALEQLKAASEGRIWAGTVSDYLYLACLEGDTSSEGTGGGTSLR